jgi:tRNA-modifying protein YgfZ
MVLRSSLEQLGSNDTWGDYQPQTPTQANSATPTKQDSICWLNQFSALKIFGADAERFLQGQLTCNLEQVTTETVHYGACCNAKGRIVANFIISFDGESYWLVLPSLSAEVLEKHLQKYKVFFKASIENCQQSHLILGQWLNGQAGSAQHSENSLTLQFSNQRNIKIIENNTSENLADLTPTLDWRLEDIQDGIHFVTAEQSEIWVPQHINWHKLDGISFNKGCYTGQEIIARLQYLGKAKKALFHYRSNPQALDNSMSVKSGQALFNTDGKNLGEILSCRQKMEESESRWEVLAVINSDSPDEVMYLTDSSEFPLTLQNLSYTEEKTV